MRATRPSRQRGVAVLIALLVVLGVGIGLVTSGVTRTIPLQVRAESRATLAMAEARNALIGRAVADDDRPGSLPCPDTKDDGVADVIGLTDCPSYIGRLPWKTLGLPDLRDEYGERLWYALSPKYRDHVSAQPINSDLPWKVDLVDPSRNDRLVYADTTATTLASQAVAIIFSPGGPVGSQLRDATVALCAATGTMIPRNWCVSNYLETADNINNASLTGPYIAGQRAADFNDRLAVLTASDIMPLVEMRVGSELRETLIEYRVESNCACFPWAENLLGNSQAGLNRGGFPGKPSLPENWDLGSVPGLPVWFTPNEWNTVIYYTAGRTSVQQPVKGLPTCSACTAPTLSIDGRAGNSALFFMPGAAAGPRSSWSDYLDDPLNRDNDDAYVTPTSKAMSRDRLFVLPGPSPLQCAANASMLVENTPCLLKKLKGRGTTKKSIKPICQYAADNLSVCTCDTVAQTLVNPPCSRKVRNSACKAAIASVKMCTK